MTLSETIIAPAAPASPVPLKVALPFQDDSSLFFAAKVAAALSERGHIGLTTQILERGAKASKVSSRQIAAMLGSGGPDLDLPETDFMKPEFLRSFDAVVTCKATALQRRTMANSAFRNRAERPVFVAFLPGLEFTPEKGMENRRSFDVVFLNTPGDLAAFQTARIGEGPFHADWGHPYFLTPRTWREPKPDAPIYFFTQAIAPQTLNGRLHMLQVLAAMALIHPRRRIVLKLRHLPDENAQHAHRERFSYPWLHNRMMRNPPPNLEFADGAMDEVLAEAGVAITCTSTAAMDAVSAGVPTMLYLDYVENYADYTVEPMRTMFKGSGLIRPLPALLDLDALPPDPDWLARHFRGEELYDSLIDAIVRWQGR
ncbi:DUF6716 putative glycosyltransferase [Rubrimonas sp.]|uniref:DUF6716 putative glycosyltransferase n=1 Tax=Rubrimonas sp. TaxID=2036015 RepID=UPI002FDDE586